MGMDMDITININTYINLTSTFLGEENWIKKENKNKLIKKNIFSIIFNII